MCFSVVTDRSWTIAKRSVQTTTYTEAVKYVKEKNLSLRKANITAAKTQGKGHSTVTGKAIARGKGHSSSLQRETTIHRV